MATTTTDQNNKTEAIPATMETTTTMGEATTTTDESSQHGAETIGTTTTTQDPPGARSDPIQGTAPSTDTIGVDTDTGLPKPPKHPRSGVGADIHVIDRDDCDSDEISQELMACSDALLEGARMVTSLDEFSLSSEGDTGEREPRVL